MFFFLGGGVTWVSRILDGCVKDVSRGCTLTCTPHMQPLQEDEDGTSAEQCLLHHSA